MSEIVNFKDEKLKRVAKKELKTDNDSFFGEYDKVTEFEDTLFRERFDEYGESSDFFRKTSKEVFGSEEKFIEFYHELMSRLGIDHSEMKPINFANFNNIASVSSQMTRVFTERK